MPIHPFPLPDAPEFSQFLKQNLEGKLAYIGPYSITDSFGEELRICRVLWNNERIGTYTYGNIGGADLGFGCTYMGKIPGKTTISDREDFLLVYRWGRNKQIIEGSRLDNHTDIPFP